MSDASAVPYAQVPKLANAGPRIDSLDLLRGVAILGIFLMNTWTMSLPQAAYTNPADYNPHWKLGYGFPLPADPITGEVFYADQESLQGINRTTYILIHLFADMKFISTFSILFGAGIVLQAHRAIKTGRNPWLTHYLRMSVLLLFGLCHTFGFWFGDILTDYAMLGMILAPVRKLPGIVLLICGIALVCAQPGFDYFRWKHLAIAQQYESAAPEEKANEPLWSKAFSVIDNLDRKMADKSDGMWRRNLLDRGLNPADYPTENDRELMVYRSGWWDQIVGHRFWCSVEGHTTEFITWTFFRCGGCILIGMGLQKLRFYHGAWPKWSYALIPLILVPLGWYTSYQGVLFNESIGWNENWYSYTSLWHRGMVYNCYGSLMCALGYNAIGVLVALIAANPARKILRFCLIPIRAVGRMALSCYLTETLIGTTLFYGHGYGTFGMFSRAELVPKVVLPTWIGILFFATLWLSVFRQGPLEWLWHSIAYWDWKNPRKAAAGPDASLSPNVPGAIGAGAESAV
jgi:uncharacterized protein